MQRSRQRRFFTTSEVADYCAVSNDGVLKWIKSGKLRAFATPGGHYRISAEDFRTFLMQHDIPIDETLFADPSGGGRVLVVDDDPDIRELVSRALADIQPALVIEQASDGYEASLMIGTFRPDLVILDVMMPRLDGISLCRTIRRNPETRDVRVLAITAHPEPQSVSRMYEAGADQCLLKPLRFEQLKLEVQRLLDASAGGRDAGEGDRRSG